MKKQIGIVITRLQEDEIKGFFCKTEVTARVDESATIRMELNVYKSYFTYDAKTCIFKLDSIKNWDASKEAAFEFKKICPKDVYLYYEGDTYYLKNERELYMK